MGPVSSVVFVVDPDASVRHSLEAAIRRAGWTPVVASAPRAFLAHAPVQAPSCLLLDIGELLPDLTGFELLRRLATERKEIPVVAMSAQPNIPLTVRAIQAGAIEFLTKPLCDDVLRAAVERALSHSQAVLEQEAELLELRDRFAWLSPRERDVMVRVVSGLLNKEAAADLGISEITVKAHRGRVMRKMGADSFAELVSMALRLRLPPVTIVRRTSPSIPWSNGSRRRLVTARILSRIPYSIVHATQFFVDWLGLSVNTPGQLLHYRSVVLRK